MPVLMSTSSGISFIEEDDDDVVFDIIDDDADIDGFIRARQIVLFPYIWYRQYLLSGRSYTGGKTIKRDKIEIIFNYTLVDEENTTGIISSPQQQRQYKLIPSIFMNSRIKGRNYTTDQKIVNNNNNSSNNNRKAAIRCIHDYRTRRTERMMTRKRNRR